MTVMRTAARAALERTAPRLLYAYQIRRKRASEPEVALLPTLCRPGAIAIDVGANQGLYAYYMRPHAATVLAFEPLPQMQERLRTLFGGRVTVHPVALSDEDGECAIRLPRGNPSWATIDPRNSLALAGDTPLETIRVATRRLDGYGLDGVGFIKIDVEGHEEAVLRGAARTIARDRPTLLVEIEERHNPGSIARVAALLAGWGYRGSFLAGGRLRPLPEFDLARDQPVGNVGVSGKTGIYINNFIFKPDGT